MFYWFSFKAFPSTEGKRHKGYIKFIKPRNSDTPLEKIGCLVDCDCKDYRYRWAWANKQRGASRVGDSSLNQAWNRAPRITNPQGRPGLCKHLIALRDYIYGQDSRFVPSEDPEDSLRLQKLITARSKVTIDSEGHPITDRERALNQRASLRRHGQDPDATVQPVPEPPTTAAPPVDPNLPINRNPRNESLAESSVVSRMESANSIKALREMVEQTKIEQGNQELPKDEQALQALQSMEKLLGELVGLQKAETAAPVEDGAPPAEPELEEPDLELPAPPQVSDEEDEIQR